MSIKSVLHKYEKSLQKAYVSAAEKVSDIVPKIGPGPLPRRDLIRLLERFKKNLVRQIISAQLKIAGRDPKLRALVAKGNTR